MREQLEHLAKLAEQPHVTLQIVPAATGAYAGTMGAFTMLRFNNEPDQVYVESHTGGQLIGDPWEVREYGLRYDLIRGAARSVRRQSAAASRLWRGIQPQVKLALPRCEPLPGDGLEVPVVFQT